jgi:hypothetical protein
MSKENNVNPGQYKVGGRLHPGDDSSRQEQAKERASMDEHRVKEAAKDYTPKSEPSGDTDA